MVVEHSPVFSSKSNGFIERGVQSVQGVVRTLRSALESRWGVRLSVDHGIWTWITEYAGWLLTRFQVGSDGKTAYERVKGKPARVQGFEFGEGVLWKRKRGGGPLGKLTCMWEDGVFLGVKGGTAELIVGDRRGEDHEEEAGGGDMVGGQLGVGLWNSVEDRPRGGGIW